MQAVGNTSLVRQIGEIPMMPPSCAQLLSIKTQILFAAQQSCSETPASPAFQGVQGKPAPNPFQVWLFQKRAAG